MDTIEALQNLGLTDKEARVYQALLQLGETSAYAISNKSGLKKPTTYVVLEDLRHKGFVQKIPRAKKMRFKAKPPEEMFALAEEKMDIARRAMPKLQALQREEQKKVNVMYFEGVNGIKQMLEYRAREMEGKEMVGFYATDPDDKSELVKYFRSEWNEKMLKLGITMRGIVPEHPSLKSYRKTDKKYGREMKIVPCETYSSDTAIDVVGDVVRIQDYKNLQGVVLENADVAKTVREIFEMVWKK